VTALRDAASTHRIRGRAQIKVPRGALCVPLGVTTDELVVMTDTIRRLALRVRPFAFLALAILVAACQKTGGGSGPGY
jgi:hypothetical protein